MSDRREIIYDVEISVDIEFSTQEADKEETINQFVQQLKSLRTCFGVTVEENSIALYEGYTTDCGFPALKPHRVTTRLTFDEITHDELLILERAFRAVISFWNEGLYRYNLGRQAFLKLFVYKAEERR